MRGLALLFATLLPLGGGDPTSGQTAFTRQQFEEDFDAMWASVRDSYAYFDARRTDWAKVKEIYRPLIADVTTPREFVTLLERAIEELHDAHAHLNTNTASSPRLVPSGADVWAEWRGGAAVVVQVRPGSAAEAAGIAAGMRILSFNGVAIAEAVRARLGRAVAEPDGAVTDWALRSLLAGRRDERRRLEVSDGGRRREVMIDDDARPVAGGLGTPPLLESRRVGADLGYIRINNSLGDVELIGRFDAALADLRHTAGLILDLRDTPSGGNTTVARGIMGRLVKAETPYQKHSIPAEERRYGARRSWIELVSPRGEFVYEAPVVVLVDHWTGSMGEGMAIGLDGMKRATVVGTRMAGLLGATSTEVLPNTRIGVTFPTEKLFHVDGTPREQFVPPVLVDLEAGGGHDPIFDTGRAVLEKAVRAHRHSIGGQLR